MDADQARRPATKKGAKGKGVDKQAEKSAEKAAQKAHTRDSLQALSKLAEHGRRPVPDRQPAADRGPVA